MCDCNTLETLNPEKEFQKYLQRRHVMQPAKMCEVASQPEEQSKCLANFKAYGIEQKKLKNIMFQTSNSDYGFFPPNQYTAPHCYRPLSQRFSNERIQFPMFCNYALNTMRDEDGN